MPAEVAADKGIVQLRTGDGRCCAAVYLHGATVTSWSVDGREKLFLSSKAVLDGSKPIRGGIPLVFPQFGVGPQSPKVQHGFARNSRWHWMGIEKETGTTGLTALFGLAAGGDAAPLGTLPDPNTPAGVVALEWSRLHPFRLVYAVALDSTGAGSLATHMRITNTSTAASFQFTALLHTYFNLPASPSPPVQTVTVHGLHGARYQDKTRDGAAFTDTDSECRIRAETDRSYMDVPGPVRIQYGSDAAAGVKIALDGFRDVVVWNPWVDKARAMADFGDQEYERMLCVEVGAVGAGADMSERQLELSPGQTLTAGQVISLV